MARQPTGQVIEDPRRGTFGLRFRALGKRQYKGLGRCTRAEAEAELQNVLADVRRGMWRPPTPTPAPEAPRVVPTFHEFASEWFDSKRRELRSNTIADYSWRLTNHLLPYFAAYPLSRITIHEVDRYRQAKVREGAYRREAMKQAAREPDRDRRARKLQAARELPGPEAESINKTLMLLSAVLEQAAEYELIGRNLAAGKRRRLRTTKPRRSYLDSAEQIAALLDAAGKLDRLAARGHPGHRHIRRRAMLAMLTFAGLRLGELLALRWRDVDLSNGRLRIADAKTAAGVRDVHLLPALRDELAAFKASANPRAEALVFPTTSGKQIGASNLRRRVLAPAIDLANVRLAEAGESPLPAALTPHSLRRTFASVLYALGRTPPVVMAEMGHTGPQLALAIYAHAMSREEGQLEALRALVNGADWAASGQHDDILPPQPLTGETSVPSEEAR
jgi:integrase